MYYDYITKPFSMPILLRKIAAVLRRSKRGEDEKPQIITGGSGLGLYIVQEILHQYGSECTVCNTQAGVKFSFII